jgi:hypothetical protein
MSAAKPLRISSGGSQTRNANERRSEGLDKVGHPNVTPNGRSERDSRTWHSAALSRSNIPRTCGLLGLSTETSTSRVVDASLTPAGGETSPPGFVATRATSIPASRQAVVQTSRIASVEVCHGVNRSSISENTTEMLANVSMSGQGGPCPRRPASANVPRRLSIPERCRARYEGSGISMASIRAEPTVGWAFC